MAKVCFKCGGVCYDGKFYHSKQPCDGAVEAIDDNLVDVVMLLRKKGYRIAQADSGQAHDYTGPNTSIQFGHPVKFQKLPRGFELFHDSCRIGCSRLVKSYFKYRSTVDAQKAILRGIIDLLNWAAAVPYYQPDDESSERRNDLPNG